MSIEHLELGAVCAALVSCDAIAYLGCHGRLRALQALRGALRDPLVQHLVTRILFGGGAGDREQGGQDGDEANLSLQDGLPSTPPCFEISVMRAW